MGLKSDSWIRKMSQEGMITPYCEDLVGEGVVSYGLSSYGYDIRVSDEFKIFTNISIDKRKRSNSLTFYVSYII
jgi:dCTP deaminase